MNKYDIVFLKNAIFKAFFPKFLCYLSLAKFYSFFIKLNIPHACNDLIILFLLHLIYDLYSFYFGTGIVVCHDIHKCLRIPITSKY